MIKHQLCIVNFKDAFHESVAWLKSRFLYHPHSLLAFIAETDMKESKSMESALGDPSLKYKPGLSELPMPQILRSDPNANDAEFLYEVIKEDSDIWVRFYIKSAVYNKWILLDEGDSDKLKKIYRVPEDWDYQIPTFEESSSF